MLVINSRYNYKKTETRGHGAAQYHNSLSQWLISPPLQIKVSKVKDSFYFLYFLNIR